MKIGILQTGRAPDDLIGRFGDYDAMFRTLLAGHGFEFSDYPVLDMVFPEAVTDAGGWLITGSKFGAYENHPWIPPLEQFIRDSFTADIPLVGICFGHQIIATALGGTVEKFAGGWSVGVTDYSFGDKVLPLNAWHQDQVTRLPQGAETVGHSPFCTHAAVVYGRNAFSVQPHPEFDADFIAGLIETRGKGVVPEPLLAEAAQRLDTPAHNTEMADMIARFFTQRHI